MSYSSCLKSAATLARSDSCHFSFINSVFRSKPWLSARKLPDLRSIREFLTIMI